MNIYQSLQQEVWVEIVSPILSNNQLEILASEDEAAKIPIYEYISNNNRITSNEPTVTLLNKLVSDKKPTEGVYEFISADVIVDGDSTSGIINYRIDGNHEQLRF